MILKAIIFDFDGVLADTEPVHMEAWLSVLEPLGISFDDDEYRENYLGRSDYEFLDAVSHIHHHHFGAGDKSRLLSEKLSASINLLEAEIPLLPGVKEFVEEASKKYLMAICSGAQRSEIEYILKHFKWINLFSPVIAADSVKKGKPDPEGYIRALEGLIERSDDVILPENVLAIEDSPKGIKAAREAGLRCLAVAGALSKEDLSGADWCVDTLGDFDLTDKNGYT